MFLEGYQHLSDWIKRLKLKITLRECKWINTLTLNKNKHGWKVTAKSDCQLTWFLHLKWVNQWLKKYLLHCIEQSEFCVWFEFRRTIRITHIHREFRLWALSVEWWITSYLHRSFSEVSSILTWYITFICRRQTNPCLVFNFGVCCRGIVRPLLVNGFDFCWAFFFVDVYRKANLASTLFQSALSTPLLCPCARLSYWQANGTFWM